MQQMDIPASLVTNSDRYRSLRSGIDDGNQTIRRLPAIASGMDIVLLKNFVVVTKPFDSGTTRPIFCSGHLIPLFGTLCAVV